MTSDRRVLTIPNVLSIARLCSVPVFVWLFLSERANVGVIVFVIAAWTDFFDGLIARRTGSVTELGKVLDPLSDRIFIVALTVMLLVRGTMPPALGAAIIVRDILILSVFPALERRGIERIPVNRVGKAATGTLFSGLAWLAYSESTFPLNEGVGDVGLAVAWLGVALYWVAAALYAREASRRMRALNASRVLP
ncbi:MAG: CDP-alcohol phosphatidyltransferase family protein [Actinomycetota bacterium]